MFTNSLRIFTIAIIPEEVWNYSTGVILRSNLLKFNVKQTNKTSHKSHLTYISIDIGMTFLDKKIFLHSQNIIRKELTFNLLFPIQWMAFQGYFVLYQAQAGVCLNNRMVWTTRNLIKHCMKYFYLLMGINNEIDASCHVRKCTERYST